MFTQNVAPVIIKKINLRPQYTRAEPVSQLCMSQWGPRFLSPPFFPQNLSQTWLKAALSLTFATCLPTDGSDSLASRCLPGVQLLSP